MKIGDKVLYVNYTTQGYFESSNRVKVGYVFHVDIDKIGIATYIEGNPYRDSRYIVFEKMLNTEVLVSLSQTNIEATIERIERVMQEKSNKIKSLTSEEKDELKRKEFDRIKEQIINTATNIAMCKDDGFIGRLNAICQLKKQMFSIKISDLNNVRKANGAIKYGIKILEEVVKELKEIKI